MTTTLEKLAGVESKKFCINCTHIGRNGGGDPIKYKCFAPQNVEVSGTDYVTGEAFKAYHRTSCYDARLPYTDKACGPHGEWFEPAPPKFSAPVIQQGVSKQGSAEELLKQLNFMK